MKTLKQAALGLGLAVAVAAPAAAQSVIKVSYQPALYWSVPYFIATEKGWWKEVGLQPEFSTFAAGAPQVAAAAAKSWDVGGTGSAPAVLGAAALQHPDHRHHQRRIGRQRASSRARRTSTRSRPTRLRSRASSCC